MLFGEKRYNTVDWYLKNRFGKKTVKLPLDGGFTCPNRDGTKGSRGCIFCSERGSGDFAGDRLKSIDSQIEDMIEFYSRKWPDSVYLAYFQNFTNTYDSIENLRDIYLRALSNPNISGICIATRPDCMGEDVLELLSELNRETFLWVELGLQTSNDETGKIIRRGYDSEDFRTAAEKLNRLGIKTVAHMIINLPGEDISDNLRTLHFIIDCGIWGVKFHMLHIMKGTDLEKYYEENPFYIMSADEYIDTLTELISRMPEYMTVHRITGDAPRELLIEPEWSRNKIYVIGNLEKKLKERNLYQSALRTEK